MGEHSRHRQGQKNHWHKSKSIDHGSGHRLPRARTAAENVQPANNHEQQASDKKECPFVPNKLCIHDAHFCGISLANGAPLSLIISDGWLLFISACEQDESLKTIRLIRRKKFAESLGFACFAFCGTALLGASQLQVCGFNCRVYRGVELFCAGAKVSSNMPGFLRAY